MGVIFIEHNYEQTTNLNRIAPPTSSRDASSIADIQRWRKIEEVRSESLHADCGPSASRTSIEIERRACLPIQVTQVRTSADHTEFRGLHRSRCRLSLFLRT